MTKIGNTGPGGIRPPEPESTESVKQTVSPKDAIPASSDYEPVSNEVAGEKQAGDKYAAGDLKTAGDRAKTQLDSKLPPKSKEVPKEIHPGFAPPYVPVGPVVVGDNIATPGAMAPSSKEVPKPPTPSFAPPYVPVGPVVMGDNIATPGAMGPSGETKQMNLKPDQFHINDQGNLIITNEKLIDFFKSLKEKATGDINLLISNLKLPDKE